MPKRLLRGTLLAAVVILPFGPMLLELTELLRTIPSSVPDLHNQLIIELDWTINALFYGCGGLAIAYWFAIRNGRRLSFRRLFVGSFACALAATFFVSFMKNNEAVSLAARFKGPANPFIFVNVMRAPGWQLSEWLYAKLWRAPSAESQFAGLANGELRLIDLRPAADRTSLVGLLWKSETGFVAGVNARGELDAGFWASKIPLSGSGFSWAFPIRDDLIFLPVYDGEMQLTPRGFKPVELPAATRADLPGGKFVFLHPQPAADGSAWFVYYSDSGSYESGSVLALRLDAQMEPLTTIRQSALQNIISGVPWESGQPFGAQALATGPSGQLAMRLGAGYTRDETWIAVFSADGRRSRSFTIPGIGSPGLDLLGTFLDDNHLIVAAKPRPPAKAALYAFDTRDGRITKAAYPSTAEPKLYQHRFVPLDDRNFLEASGSDGLQAIGADLKVDRDLTKRILTGPCGSKLRGAQAMFALKYGVIVRLALEKVRSKYGDHEPSAVLDDDGRTLIPILKLKPDGSLDEDYNYRLIRKLCR